MAEYAHFALSQFDPANRSMTKYWQDKLQGGDRTNLRFQDKGRFLRKASRKSKSLGVEISDDMLMKLQRGNKKNKTTLTQLVTCAAVILWFRLTEKTYPIQMATNLRDRFEFENLMGDFVSSLPLMLKLKPQCSIRDVFNCYEKALLEIQRYKRCNTLELSKWLTPEGGDFYDMRRFGNILVDSNDRDTLIDVTDFANKTVSTVMEDRDLLVPLMILLLKTNHKFTMFFIYDVRFFSRRTIQLFAENTISLLNVMIKNPELLIREVDILSELRNRLDVKD